MQSLDAPASSLRCSKPFQISGLGTETRLSYTQTLQSADSEINILSGLLLSWSKW